MKEQIHNDYLQRMKEEHAHKMYPREGVRAVCVIGAGVDNIGSEIADRLEKEQMTVIRPTIDELDVTSPSACHRWFLEHFWADTLVLSHGVTSLDWFEDMMPSEMADIIKVNLLGTMYAISAFVQASIGKSYRKRIVVIGSMAHRMVLNASAAYCASKAGVAHLVRCLGWELTPKGFDVFAVHPSNTIGTPMTQHTVEEIARYRDLSEDDAIRYWGSINLMAKWLDPSDIAEVVHFLITSPSASYLSGTQIELSGGQR